MQFYTDPSRESDAHAQPHVEIYNVPADVNDPDGPTEHGWYWGLCRKNARAHGPFDAEALAIAAARSNASDDADTPYVEHAVKGWKNLGANYEGGRQIKLIDTDRTSSAFVMVGGRDHNANARLIEAGPSLLAACKLVVARWEKGDLAEAANACSAAIADAQGGAA